MKLQSVQVAYYLNFSEFVLLFCYKLRFWSILSCCDTFYRYYFYSQKWRFSHFLLYFCRYRFIIKCNCNFDYFWHRLYYFLISTCNSSSEKLFIVINVPVLIVLKRFYISSVYTTNWCFLLYFKIKLIYQSNNI